MSNKKTIGTVFEIERYAVHDGPGIRTVVFLKGCPLRCGWCANPESQNSGMQLMYWHNRCMNCQNCIKSCPLDALSWNGEKIVINREVCNVCSICTNVCNSEALTIVGKKMSVSEVIDVIMRDYSFYKQSGGGVTFSGGEAFSQPEFLSELAIEAHRIGIHTCIETSGFVDQDILSNIAKHIDLFLYDFKCMDPAMHKLHTGVSNEKILENYKYLIRSGIRTIVRMPIVPTQNDTDSHIKQATDFLEKYSPGCRVDILPYHSLGATKYDRLDKTYLLSSIKVPTSERMEQIKDYLEKHGFIVTIGG